MIILLIYNLCFASAGKNKELEHIIQTESQGLVQFIPVKGYATTQEANIIVEAGKKLDQVVRGECFSNFLKNRKMIQTKGQTSAQVVAHIQNLKGKVPVVMYYRRFTSAVAYRQPPEITINLNRKYFYSGLPICDWASTMAHEALGHSLGGYEHDFNWNKQRDFSVPYSLNAAIDSCCKK